MACAQTSRAEYEPPCAGVDLQPPPPWGTNWELFLALTSCCNSAGNTVLRCCHVRKQTLTIGHAHSAYDHKRTEGSEKESRVVIATEKVNYGQARMQPKTEPDEGLKDRVFSERPQRRGGVCRLRSPRDEYYASLDVNFYRIGRRVHKMRLQVKALDWR